MTESIDTVGGDSTRLLNSTRFAERILEGPRFRISTLVEPGNSPGLRDVLGEHWASIAFWRDRRCFLPAVWWGFHLATATAFIAFWVNRPGWLSVVSMVVVAALIGTVFNTVWLHRFTSHRAFKIRHRWFRILCLLANPLGFREEIYAIPHFVHHQCSDTVFDPYGPHLGVVGSYLASETQQRYSQGLAKEDHKRLLGRLSHLPLVFGDFDHFKKWSSLEHIAAFLGRFLFTQLAYSIVLLVFGGPAMWVGFYASVFLFTALMRDFNYRGHGGVCGSNAPLDQWFYGVLVSEWHSSHHSAPYAARSGLGAKKPDLAYWMIRALAAIGIAGEIRDISAS